MATETFTLRIVASRLGTVSEVTNLLTDLDKAYNSIFAFDFIVETLYNDNERQLKQLDERLTRHRKYWKEFYNYRKDYPFDPFMFEMFFEENTFSSKRITLPNLLELQNNIQIEDIVLSTDKLYISKINIQSKGFLEIIGGANPLKEIRKYLKDRHERKKDKEYRNQQEKEMAELLAIEKGDYIIAKRIEMLKSLNYPEAQIRQMVEKMVSEPLKKLGEYQDKGQIDEPEE